MIRQLILWFVFRALIVSFGIGSLEKPNLRETPVSALVFRADCPINTKLLQHSLKQEEVCRRAYETVTEAEQRIADYLALFQ